MSRRTTQIHRQRQRAAISRPPWPCPASWLIFCLALGCGARPVDPRPPVSSENLFEWVFGQHFRVTRSGASEAALLLTGAAPDGSASGAQKLVACGLIDDVLPYRRGTNKYFLVVDGALYLGALTAGASRQPIVINRTIQIRRLLLLDATGRVLLVEEVPQKGREQGRLWRLTIMEDKGQLRATAHKERKVDDYKREFRNARCRGENTECFDIGRDVNMNPVIDIESSPGAHRNQYLVFDVQDFPEIYRVAVHPDRPDKVLLLTACSKQ